MKWKDISDEQTPPIADGLFEKLKNYLLQQYIPSADLTTECITKTTAEIYQSLQSIYPSASYYMDDVARLMHEAGFNFLDTTGNMKFEWILHPNN